MQLLRAESKPLERSGFYVLHAFTPFKLLESYQNVYLIQLINISSFKVYSKEQPPREQWWWCKPLPYEHKITLKRCKDKEITKKIITPRELLPTAFSRNVDQQYIYVRYDDKIKEKIKNANLQDHISILKDTDLFKKGIPIYLEFSYQALQEPYVCKLGYVILSSSSTCPLRECCPRIEYNESGQCKLYIKVNNTYAGLYHVHPLVEKRFDYEVPSRNVVIIPFKYFPLIKISFTEEGEVTGYINSIILIPKRRWLFQKPRFYLYPNPTIGIKLSNVHALIFEFDVENLRNIILDILANSELTYRWLAFKYYSGRYRMIKKVRNKAVSKIVDGFRGFDWLNSVFEHVAKSGTKSVNDLIDLMFNKKLLKNEYSEDFINFVSFVLVHTFAHVMIAALSVIYDIPEGTLLYHIEHPILRCEELYRGRVKLIIFEDALGGYGYLKNITNRVKEYGDIQPLHKPFKYIVELLERENKLLESCQKNLKNDIYRLLDSGVSDSLKSKIWERVERILEFINKTGVYPHVMTFRSSILSGIEPEDERERSTLEELFSNMPLCWDGCLHCVMLERDCTYTPYDQPFIVSRNLIKEFIKRLMKSLEKMSFSLYFTKVKDYVNEVINEAEHEILISTASLSTVTLDTLSSMLSRRRNLKIKVLAHKDSLSDRLIYRKVMEVRDKHRNFEIKFHDRLHAKGILIDDLVLLKGSFNFTMKGLEVNVENIDIVYHPEDIIKFKEGFNKVWRESTPFK